MRLGPHQLVDGGDGVLEIAAVIPVVMDPQVGPSDFGVEEEPFRVRNQKFVNVIAFVICVEVVFILEVLWLVDIEIVSMGRLRKLIQGHLSDCELVLEGKGLFDHHQTFRPGKPETFKDFPVPEQTFFLNPFGKEGLLVFLEGDEFLEILKGVFFLAVKFLRLFKGVNGLEDILWG